MPEPKANERQVGGDHYSKHGDLQHWDIVAHFGLDYFQGQVLRYVMRYKDKDGIKDLEKARHYLDKMIELEKESRNPLKPQPGDRPQYFMRKHDGTMVQVLLDKNGNPIPVPEYEDGDQHQ